MARLRRFPDPRREAGGRPRRRKALGQHHLRSGGSCRPLLDFLAPAGARVVEIGPGGGVLTRELLAAGARVVGWELDRAWAIHLRQEIRCPELQVVAADALDLPWERLRGGTAVAGNLPYAIATVLVADLVRRAHAVGRAAFLVQKEVAERLAAPPGGGAYGALSVLVATRARATLLGRLPPGAFVPPPRVESAFVGLELGPPRLAPGEFARLERLVHAAFGQRRKTLRNALGAAWGRAAAERALAAAGIPPTERAEGIDLDGFLRLLACAPGPVGAPCTGRSGC